MRKHYYLMCAEVTFMDAEGDTGIARVNVMQQNDFPRLGIRQIARAQQGAQVQLMQKLGKVSITVLNVVIISASYIGHMSQEEFQEGTAELEAEAAAQNAAQEEVDMSGYAETIEEPAPITNGATD